MDVGDDDTQKHGCRTTKAKRQMNAKRGENSAECREPEIARRKNQMHFLNEDGQTLQNRNGSDADTLPTSRFNSTVSHPAFAETALVSAGICMFVPEDEGQQLQRCDVDLPNAQVLHACWRYDWLCAATHGRTLRRSTPCRQASSSQKQVVIPNSWPLLATTNPKSKQDITCTP